MEKTRSISLIYGYLVCLVAIVVTLISASMLINAVFNLQDPIRVTDYRYSSRNLSSFEAYKASYDTGTVTPELKTPASSTTTLTDDQLKAAYESEKENKIASVKFDAKRNITNSVLLLIIAAALFVTHWRWLGRLNRHEVTAV